MVNIGTWVRFPGPLPSSYYFLFYIPMQRIFQGLIIGPPSTLATRSIISVQWSRSKAYGMVQLVERALGKHWDLGSIPRSPPFLILFCFPYSYAACIPGVHHTPNAKACQVSWKIHLKVRMGGPGNTPVNAYARGQKSQKRPPINGPDCWQFTS